MLGSNWEASGIAVLSSSSDESPATPLKRVVRVTRR